jgi:hypothetical protein
LESKYKSQAERGFADWILSKPGQEELKLLLKWAPEKLPELLSRGVRAQQDEEERDMRRVGKEVAEHLSAAQEDLNDMEEILRAGGAVIPPIS